MPQHFTTIVNECLAYIEVFSLSGLLDADECLALLAWLREEYEDYLLWHTSRTFSYPKARYNIDELEPYQVWEVCRFERVDLPRLIHVLRLPDYIWTRNRYFCDSREALVILLWRISHINKWSYGIDKFHRSISALCEIVYWMLDHITTRFAHLLQLPAYFCEPARVREYATAIYTKGAPLSNCAFFIDGKRQRIAKPSVLQQTMYSGKDKMHCCVWQNVVTPGGLIVHQHGPCEGRMPDSWIANLMILD